MIKNKLKSFYKKYIFKVSKEELELLKEYEIKFPKVLTTKETIDYIIDNKCSLCRFGDGEFDICNQENKNDPYQTPSDELTKRLKEILQYKSNDKIIIAIPPFNSNYNNLTNYYGKLSFWQWYWLKKFSKINKLLTNEFYGNSFVSRETVFYENNYYNLKKIWENRNVIFVYGENGRFNIKSEIFNNIKYHKTILVKPTHAFNDYKEILSKCLIQDKEVLFIIAAGPTATVLAFDLAKSGYQALDIGHLPNCYDQYLGKIKSPESLPLIKNDVKEI